MHLSSFNYIFQILCFCLILLSNPGHARTVGMSDWHAPEAAGNQTIKEYCSHPRSFHSIPYFPWSWWEFEHATVSDGSLCCELCWESNINCVTASYDSRKDSNNCILRKRAFPSGELPPTDYCPNGVFDSSRLKQSVEREDWYAWILGPCLTRHLSTGSANHGSVASGHFDDAEE